MELPSELAKEREREYRGWLLQRGKEREARESGNCDDGVACLSEKAVARRKETNLRPARGEMFPPELFVESEVFVLGNFQSFRTFLWFLLAGGAPVMSPS